jgi:hypothetical protein
LKAVGRHGTAECEIGYVVTHTSSTKFLNSAETYHWHRRADPETFLKGLSEISQLNPDFHKLSDFSGSQKLPASEKKLRERVDRNALIEEHV